MSLLKRIRLLFILFLLFIPSMVAAYADSVEVAVYIKEIKDSQLKHDVSVHSEGEMIQRPKVVNNRVTFFLAYGEEYTVYIISSNHCLKKVIVNTENIPPSEKERGGFIVPIELDLREFPNTNGNLDCSGYANVHGGYCFVPEVNDIVFVPAEGKMGE